MVRGYHVYRDIWTAIVRNEIQCQREGRNQFDPFAAAVMKGGRIISHVQRNISSICSLFLHRDGAITCRVTSGRHYSGDLVLFNPLVHFFYYPRAHNYKQLSTQVGKAARRLKILVQSHFDVGVTLQS